jgi:hypothetical protein
MKRFLWLGFVASVYLICTGCGDTFRPIIIPNPPTFPNPRAAHTVLSINHNFECADPACGSLALIPGSAMVIDVSGDTDVSEFDVNLAPVHAAQQAANQVLVVNQAVTGVAPPPSGCLVISGTQTLNVCPTLTKLIFNGTVIAGTNTITLPPSSAANFVAVAPLDTTAYVSLPTYVPDPVKFPLTVVPSVGVVNTSNNSLLSTIPLSNNPATNPVALAVTPDKSKLYVANEGDGTLSAFNTVGLSNRGVSPANTSSPPIWLVARTDNQRVYVLEETTGVLASIDTTATAGPDPLTEYPSISVPGATTMVYDPNKNRLYIPGGPVMAIVDVSQSPPVLMATIVIPNVPALPNSVSASAVAVAALPDASRAYVASIVALPSQATVSAVQGDGTTAIYTYTWTGGHDLTPGITVAVSGLALAEDGFNGTYTITAVSGTSCETQTCTFQAANTTVLTTKTTVTGSVASTIDNLFPQITVVDVASNTVKSTFGIPGFPDATVVGSPYYAKICATTRFRFMMAAGGDSTRTYLSSCDGGNVNIIDTAVDKYVLNLPVPVGARAPIPPSLLNPPQNPVFLIAGP